MKIANDNDLDEECSNAYKPSFPIVFFATVW